jgi:2-C-methyl-D-erythritol 2,4-cyclodiphosphate synthase
MLRIGEGYDVHALSEGRPLMIGCVEVPSPLGSVGHSDGDVLAHAVCDALLGALGAGDIGSHFPPDQQKWRGAASRVFLEGVAVILRERGARVINVDATVVLEAPRLSPHIDDMRAALAAALGCQPSQLSIKAKTAEGLGAVGEGNALEARAVALVELDDCGAS